MIKKNISLKNKAYVDEYLINGLNITQAYKKIYPKSSDKTALEQGSRLLSRPLIKDYLDIQSDKISKKLDIKKEDLINILLGIAKDDKSKDNDKINSIKIISQMLGYNSPTQIDNKHFINNNLSDLLRFDE